MSGFIASSVLLNRCKLSFSPSVRSRCVETAERIELENTLGQCYIVLWKGSYHSFRIDRCWRRRLWTWMFI